MLRVQAEGYVSALKSVRLQNGTSLAMMLTPVATIPEQESNNSIGNAQRLKPGQSASFVIDEPSDQDWFVFDLPEATRVKLAFNSCPLETTASIFDSAGERVAHLNRYGGRPANGVWDLARGHYSIRVTEWGMNGSSKEEIIMTLSAETAADPLEDNDSPTAARPIQVGQHMRGLLFPVGDADHFTLHLDRPGCLRLDSMYNSGIERAVHIFDKNDNLIPGGEKKLLDISRGYVSYLRGENPYTFPIRLTPKSAEIINTKMDINGNKIPSSEKMRNIKLIPAPMSKFQLNGYLDIVEKEENTIVHLAMISNIAFANKKGSIISPTKSYSEIYQYSNNGRGAFIKEIRKKRRGGKRIIKFKYQSHLINNPGKKTEKPFLDLSILNVFSSKMAKCIENIKKSNSFR